MSVSATSRTTAAPVTATYLANTSLSPRSGTVTIAGQSITINQAAATPCTFSASPTSVATIAASGSSTIFTVSASPSGCSGGSWTATVSDPSWMSVSATSGTTAASVTATYLANTSLSPRSGTVTIAGQSITINQAAATPCTFSASPTSVATIAASGSSTIFTVNASPSGCTGGSWTASVSDPSWMSVSATSGTTAASVTATYLANTSLSPRSGTVTIAGQSITINQAAATPCTFLASPTSVVTIPASGSSTIFTISASPSGCSGGSWTAVVSDPSWMSVAPTSGTTAGSVTATYLANTGPARSGTVTIAGLSIPINQAAATLCTFSASPTSVATIAASGGSTTFTVSASPIGCSGGSWAASVSDPSWMSVAPTSGTSAGSVTATYLANTGTSSRSGTVTIAGQSITVNQGAPTVTCAFSVTPTSVSTISASGGSTAFTVDRKSTRLNSSHLGISY